MKELSFNDLFNTGTSADHCPVRLLGIRGALESAGVANDGATYDDVIGVCIADPNGGPSSVKWYRATTDPTRALVKNPINPEGAAQLKAGLWWFEKHLLHGDPAKKCLGQSRDVTIYRLDSAGNRKTEQTGQFGICIHSMGSGMNTQRFSAGCNGPQNDDGYFGDPFWTGFIHPIRAAMDTFNLTEVPYLLLEDSGYILP